MLSLDTPPYTRSYRSRCLLTASSSTLSIAMANESDKRDTQGFRYYRHDALLAVNANRGANGGWLETERFLSLLNFVTASSPSARAI